jgi:hypothetical protein
MFNYQSSDSLHRMLGFIGRKHNLTQCTYTQSNVENALELFVLLCMVALQAEHVVLPAAW